MYSQIGATIIKRVAEQMDKDEKEVRTEICKAIDIAYSDRDTHEKWMELFGNQKPTPEAFIVTITNYITAENGTLLNI